MISPYTPKPTKCACNSPIWRFLNGEWTCLNCPLFQAIYIDRDDNERTRLVALINSTRPERMVKR